MTLLALEGAPEGAWARWARSETPPWSPRTGIPHVPIGLLFTLGTPVRICMDGGVVVCHLRGQLLKI